MKKKILITGVAGFVGFHLAQALLAKGYTVIGIDSIEPYYDVRMKHKRLAMLGTHRTFRMYKKSIADYAALEAILKKEKPQELVHLAAQAGVRYSLKNPWAYVSSNYLGTLNVFEGARRTGIKRVLYASSSSVYGNNKKMPFAEGDRTDTQISIYGASKKANEVLAYSYHDMYNMEMTGLRFFTVYGQWGRPDLALFKFVRRILNGEAIELYNRGTMKRSFTHVSDIVRGIEAILSKPSKGAYNLYNLGGAEAISLKRFVSLIEKNLGVKARKKLLPMQAGDVKETVADTSLARKELGYIARVTMEEGVKDFTEWFMEHKKFLLSLKESQQ